MSKILPSPPMSETELDILEYLMSEAPRPVPRLEIALVAMGIGQNVDIYNEGHYGGVMIHHIRKKLGDRRGVIQTKHGHGYFYCDPDKASNGKI